MVKKKKLAALILAAALLMCIAPCAAAADGEQIRAANTLYSLGLLSGTDTNADGTPVFDLDGELTREQAVAVLTRLLGEEDAAFSSDFSHPFADVSPWADKYIAYAYAKGYAAGHGGSIFGGEDAITLQQYLAFVLRALGYTDGVDFAYSEAVSFARSIGLYSGSYKDEITRGDMALISKTALQTCRNGGLPLLQELVSMGAVSRSAAESSGFSSLLGAQLSAGEIYGKYSSAVLYIEVYNAEGLIAGTGSGFFIEQNGTAVTSFHVLSGGHSAIVKTADGKSYNVTGVYDYDVDTDLAIIKVEGSGFNTLPLGDSDSIAVGDTVYVIGAPLGLSGTVSQGLISYIDRTVYGSKYLQFSAAIAQGSSGGPIINTRGQVIGVVCGTFASGQNLNLALPSKLLNALSDRQLDSVAAVSGSAPAPSAEISVSPEALQLKVGEYGIIDIEYSSGLGTFVSASFKDFGHASAAFLGNGISGSIDLMISGVYPGETTIHIAVCDADHNELAYVDVPLTITE